MQIFVFTLFLIFQSAVFSATCFSPDDKNCQTQGGLDTCTTNCTEAQNTKTLKLLSSKILFSPEGLALVEKLKKENFICDEESVLALKKGILCKGVIKPYSQPVRFYISPNYKKQYPPVISLHFHGHRLNNYDTFQTNPQDTNGYGDYGARLTASGSTDLLVIPESKLNCFNYDNELWGSQRMKAFTAQVEMKAGLENANYKLSAHSGGGRILDQTLTNKSLESRVKSVGLFDAIYEDKGGVRDYLKKSSDNKVFLSVVEGGTTQKNTDVFLKTVSAQISQIKIKSAAPEVAKKPSLLDHMKIMNVGNFEDYLKN